MVVTAIGALPLVLLVVPAARRPGPATTPRSSSAARDQPQGWTRPFAAGWGAFGGMVVIGGLLGAGGLVMALTGRGAEGGAGAAIALFFLACLWVAPLFAPRRRGGLLAARRGWGRSWRLLLTPSAVVIAMGGAPTVVPWAAIQQVRASQVTTHVRGVAVTEPLVGIDLSDPEAIQTGPLERLLVPLNRRLADITLPIRTLDIDPALLLEALRYYHQHPRARAELATQAGLARLHHGQSPSTQPAGQ